MIQDEAMIVEEIVTLTSLLGGTIEKYEVTDSKGNAYKKIIICLLYTSPSPRD